MSRKNIFILAAKRTPIGSVLGQLSSLPATELAAVSHRAAIESAKLSPESIDEVINGCVLPAGIGQAPARQAAIKAGVPMSAGATTLNKMCGSGMKAVMVAYDTIQCEEAQVILAGGMESMSNAPYLLQKARKGYRLGHSELYDHMFLDGLEDAYQPGQAMGMFAETTAIKYGLTRQMQDEFATRSLQRAIEATENGLFAHEITPVTLNDKKGEIIITCDEGPNPDKLEKISRLKPAFKKDGTVTAANASSISDGAASIVLASESFVRQENIQPIARLVAHATHSQAPEWFTTAPAPAIKKVLSKAGWHPREVDLYEINEAFAVVTMAAMADLELNPEQVNIYGGACTLGHPIGASGARIIVTLINALKHQNLKKGIAALCIGGGEATACAIELV